MNHTLYFAPGTCSRVVMAALAHLDLACQAEQVKLAEGQQRSAAYLAINPKGKVPVLVTPEGPLTDVIAIAVYLDDQATIQGKKERLLPLQGFARATAMSWLSWCAGTIHPLIYRLRMTARIHPDVSQHEIVRTAAMQELTQQLQVAEQQLSSETGLWLAASEWTLADAYLLWAWQRAQLAGLDSSQWPALEKWSQRAEQHPSWQLAMAIEAKAS
ncbi:glutathione S-transferase family protein [Pokkaliibacter sp. MBI-7]|uniref:glutathione S-transferase family protein n=1 Tax=Pokkaliibacter sp. MBI-7 TaxID=3040600 RepID=UPI00244B44FC|nr:glutathione S-transferase family protein [Pokkaliibacter sp. MBI-7]MDH2435378.1 glutathione S-transferase family protein [Pokkaliibacter sp. MBI-7]